MIGKKIEINQSYSQYLKFRNELAFCWGHIYIYMYIIRNIIGNNYNNERKKNQKSKQVISK